MAMGPVGTGSQRGALPGERVASARFLDPGVLARIGNLDLVSRLVVDGFISGLHQAVFQGVSTDFAEHRPYAPGDDIRRIDWRVFGRTDRLYLKTFEAETNADLNLAIDVSASMGYASAAVTKFEYAQIVVATLAHLGSRQRDRVGLAVLGGELERALPPSARRREALMRMLAGLEASGPGDLVLALGQLAQQLKRRGIVVVVSDFYLAVNDAIAALDELRLRGHDVIAVQVFDPVEVEFGLAELGVLEDMESGERLAVDPERIREQYLAAVTAHLDELERECTSRRIDFLRARTDRPLDGLLFEYLSRRSRQRSGRARNLR